MSYSQPSGAYISVISQADADSKGLDQFNTDGLANANTKGICTFYSAPLSGSFIKSPCVPGATPSSVPYNQAYGAAYSNSSQADADAKGLTKFNADGQANANINGNCTFYNVAKTAIFVRNDCSAGGKPSNMPYTVVAYTYNSNISQLAADNLAQADIDNNGQSFVNAHAYCEFKNVAKSAVFTKNNCLPENYPSSYEYIVPANVFTSHESQQAADNLALSVLNTYGQNYVNTYGTCTFINTAKSASFTRNNCEAGGYPGTIVYNVPIGKYSSTVSQAAVDAVAQSDVNNNGQAYANSNASCMFYNKLLNAKYYKTDCPEGTTNPYVYYSVEAGKYLSYVSQAHADNMAIIEANTYGPAYANEIGRCLNPGELEE